MTTAALSTSPGRRATGLPRPCAGRLLPERVRDRQVTFCPGNQAGLVWPSGKASRIPFEDYRNFESGVHARRAAPPNADARMARMPGRTREGLPQ